MEQFRSGLNRGSLPNLELAAAVNVVAEDKVLRLVIGDSRRSDAAGIDLAFLDTGDAVQEDRSGTVALAEDKLAASHRKAREYVSRVVGRESGHAYRLEVEQRLKR